MTASLDILFENEWLIAVNKPYGYFVHRSALDQTSEQIILPILRKMLGQRVYPVHRLDRKTTGVLLFAKDKHVQKALNAQFREKKVEKTYKAIIRGHIDSIGKIDYPLKNDRGKTQDALTHYECLQNIEVPFSTGKFPTSRYAYIKLTPETGRQHQLRKHLAHIFHPIIGDRPHGCNKQNRYFLQHFQLKEMMLHAHQLKFKFTEDSNFIEITAPFSSEMKRIAKILKISL